MRACLLLVPFALLFALVQFPQPSQSAPVPPMREKLVDQVKKAIENGKKFLIDQEKGKGHWEHTHVFAQQREGGFSALALLALLNAGMTPEDAIIKRGLEYLRTLEPQWTYTVGLQTMVFCLAAQEADKERIQRNVKWLLETRRPGGWSYNAKAFTPDNSNTQYALLGLHEAHIAGYKMDEKTLKELRDLFIQTQRDGGGWVYRQDPTTTFTMTTAGLCNLIITGNDLYLSKAGRPKEDGSVTNCGKYDENQAVAEAMKWLASRFPSPLSRESALRQFRHPFYALYGLERAGRLTGQRFFGNHDWYRLGCEFLIPLQSEDGSWSLAEGSTFDHWPVVATSFALLFLSKGRAPVLLTKFAHGDGDGWNNKRSDCKHLVEFCSRELFQRQPLAWQTFDTRAMRIENQEKIDQLTEELLQSPIVYLNGHSLRQMSDNEEKVLARFMANGGFIMAEACCNREDFDRGFKALLKRILPDSQLKPLEPGHPVWTASGKFKVSPKRFKLEGVQEGCKTVVIYSPQALAGWWELNEYDKGSGQEAFQLAANIIAYATGMEPPRPRLHDVEIAREQSDKKPPAGYFQVAQLRHGGDWQPAPRAMRNLMLDVAKLQMEVNERTEQIQLIDRNVTAYKFFYMHGRNTFPIPARRDLEELVFTLESGGVLFADAACGSARFNDGFRKLMKEMWPDKELEPIKLEENSGPGQLFSKELNGVALKQVRCRREGPDGKPSVDYQTGPPLLEGIKHKGRWIVIYSKYDIGCALEKHQSTDCLGHDTESAKRLGRAVVLYAMRR